MRVRRRTEEESASAISHSWKAQVSRGALVHGVGDNELVPAVAQASQPGADGDDPRLVVPGL